MHLQSVPAKVTLERAYSRTRLDKGRPAMTKAEIDTGGKPGEQGYADLYSVVITTALVRTQMCVHIVFSESILPNTHPPP